MATLAKINGGKDLTTAAADMLAGATGGTDLMPIRIANTHAANPATADVWIEDGAGVVVARLCKNFSVNAGDARDLGRWPVLAGQKLRALASAASTLHLAWGGIARSV